MMREKGKRYKGMPRVSKTWGIRIYILLGLLGAWTTVCAQMPVDDGTLTLRPKLQQLGERLLKGKQGSIVAIRPETGEILCLATNSSKGSDVALAIATPSPACFIIERSLKPSPQAMKSSLVSPKCFASTSMPCALSIP